MLQGIKFIKKDQDKQVPSSQSKQKIEEILEKDLAKSKTADQPDASKKRWQKSSNKVNENQPEQIDTSAADHRDNRKFEVEERQDPYQLCDDAVDFFMKGNFSRFEKIVDKLENIKAQNIRNLINQEEQIIMLTAEDNFNEKFRNEAAGNSTLMGVDDDEELKSDVEEPKVFKNQLLGQVDEGMQMEMLLQKRNLMMKIRQNDNEFKKYDLMNDNYDSELIQKKMRKGEEERYEKREGKRQLGQAKKHQKILQKCVMCYYQEGKFDYDLQITQSDNIYVSFPIKTSPLCPSDKEPLSHIILAPKSHYASFVEIEEQVQNELRNFQKCIVTFYQEELDMQTVFIETCIQSEHELPHAYLECIGVPNDLENEFDIELFFRKSFLEDDSEWGTHKKIIDTKEKKGMIWKCIPTGGSFSYVHIDFNGLGGFAHIIEDARKYNQIKALEVLGGAIGHDYVNINVPMRKEKALKYVRDIKKKFTKYDWTKHTATN